MSFVLDPSVAVAWAFADEAHPVTAEALALIRSNVGRVPSLWWFEVRNVLIVNERRGRLGETDTALFLRPLARLPIVVDGTPEETAVLTLARRHGLTVYDASRAGRALRRAACHPRRDIGAGRGVRKHLTYRPGDLAPQKHVRRAAGGAARGAERSANNRTHGTGARGPFRASALHPRDRAGYRVSIAR
jgi:predicted nucleic acid-binding protein